MNCRKRLSLVWFVLFAAASLAPAANAKWKYFRTGNSEDRITTPRAGFALMGGGGKQDDAFKWLCERANGGDFLILRAGEEGSYIEEAQKYVQGLCPVNSVATILFNDREDSGDPKISEIIDKAEAIFIAGGDQSNYVRYWQDTPVQDALNRHIAAGKPIGGSSAGLAILGEFSFASIIDTIHSPEALADPYGNKVTLSQEFLQIPLLQGVITDTHFVKRDRMGRLLVFMARILQDGWTKRVRGIAVEENASVLLEPDGQAKVAGNGPAYFLESTAIPEVCQHKKPLSIREVRVQKIVAGAAFNVKEWKGKTAESYSLSVTDGKVTSSASKGNIY